MLSDGVAANVDMLLMRCLSELTAAHPSRGAIGSYARSFLSRRAGFVVRTAYVLPVVEIVGSWSSCSNQPSRGGSRRCRLRLRRWGDGRRKFMHLAGERMFARVEFAGVVVKTLALLALITLACH
ncbi:hypothetical protein [Achromobacter kerstersii]|uniref:hypothetical protein n=1 Tax=Achromobacter kerstersii TaxID=1353890 RepID=UPI00158331BE|nr:hypothetical protein [Achromobacter kerstersii]